MQPGKFQPRGEDWLVRRLQELEARVQRNEAANPYTAMGIKPVAGGINITGDLSVSGTISSLPSGSIPNSSLADPISPGAYHSDIQNISITNGPNVEKLRIDVPVPAGYTRALVSLTATMNMLNNTTAPDSAYLSASINGTAPGWASNGTAAAGAEVALSNTAALLVTGLSGGTLPLTGNASSNTGTWAAAGTSSVMNLDATVLFLR